MIHLNPFQWQWQLKPPAIKDVRWQVCFLLLVYLLLGVLVLGFSRNWQQIVMIIGITGLLDMLFGGLIHRKVRFPLSAVITALSIAILLNFSYDYRLLWLPALLAIASKYVFTLKQKHVFNPSLFAICLSLWVSNDMISLSPAYQWFGNAELAWTMSFFIITGSVLLFFTKINRHWLVLSFLGFYALQTALRAYILRDHIPSETLFIGMFTSPAFYLFTFYMITDPATSPGGKRPQILTGFLLAMLDLYFHTKFSLYTFFYAAFTLSAGRYVYGHLRQAWPDPFGSISGKKALPKLLLTGACSVGIILLPAVQNKAPETTAFQLERLFPEYTGLNGEKSDILEQTDPRIRHIAKWMLSVGDAVAVADVNLDDEPDLYLTQTLKSPEWRGKLYLNQGSFRFEKFPIRPLEQYLDQPAQHGLPAAGLFFDMDNDGDPDLFTGFGFGKSHLFENRIIPDDSLYFVEKPIPFLEEENTVCLAANALDFNKDGWPDLLITNVMPPYMRGYEQKTPFNIFDLPEPAYDDDRRMFRFMHESWHNANNGGTNHLLINKGGKSFEPLPNDQIHFEETRWSLATGTADLNGDGYTDIYIANDFGKDDCYLNIGGRYWERQQGRFYGDIGKDTYKGMNVSIADLDGNLQEDIYISNVHHAIQAEGSLLWMNYTPEGFPGIVLKERAAQKNALNPNRFGWGAAVADFDLDGWTDIVQANGMVGDEWDKIYDHREDYWYYQMKVARSGPEIHGYADKWADIRGKCIYENEADRLYWNDRGEGFRDVARQVGLDHLANTRGIAAVDLDNNGAPDLIITDQFGPPVVYQNKRVTAAWIGLSLTGNGTRCNRDAIGCKITLTYRVDNKEKVQFREIRAMTGFSAQSDSRQVFGFGCPPEQLSGLTVTVDWMDGQRTVLQELTLDRYHTITQSPDPS